MKKINVFLFLWDPESNEYDLYKYHAGDRDVAMHFVECMMFQLTPVIAHVHVKVVEDKENIIWDWHMNTLDKTLKVNIVGESEDVESMRRK